jgi:hypothetical protein
MDLLNATLARTRLRDAANRPLRYTPHDFRRIFATDAVTGGLPVHIVAKLLGHQSLATTEAYTAIFQDQLVRTYRTFLDQRRSVRPKAEYREPTDDEWCEFSQHFALRKVELGTCGRPYGSPCRHEHAPLLHASGRPRTAIQIDRDHPEPYGPHSRREAQRLARRRRRPQRQPRSGTDQARQP